MTFLHEKQSGWVRLYEWITQIALIVSLVLALVWAIYGIVPYTAPEDQNFAIRLAGAIDILVLVISFIAVALPGYLRRRAERKEEE